MKRLQQTTNKMLLHVLLVYISILPLLSAINPLIPCSSNALNVCSDNYNDCLSTLLQESDHCPCLEAYYGCTRTAGCIGDLFEECTLRLQAHSCTSTTLCGLLCSDEEDDILLKIDNRGRNHIQILTCPMGLDTQLLADVAIRKVTNCNAIDFEICERWIAPSSTTTVSIPKATTYLELRLCGLRSTVPTCLTSSYAVNQLYGTPKFWSNNILIDKSDVLYCEEDADCPEDSKCIHGEGKPLAICDDVSEDQHPSYGVRMWLYAEA